MESMAFSLYKFQLYCILRKVVNVFCWWICFS